MTALLPEGFRDALPPYADAAAQIESAILGVAHSHGYERVDPPLAEFAEGLASRLKAGGLRDAVRFVDPVSQATLAIRPDLTAQVARIAATRMGHHPRPVRLSYAGTTLKLRAPQLAPARERRQIGCELIGLDSIAAAIEIVSVAVEALEAAGAMDLSIDFTLPDLVDTLAADALPVPVEEIDALRERLDAKDAGGVAALAPAYMPLVEAAGPFDAALARLRSFDTRGLLASRLDGLAAIASTLAGRVTLTLDPTERHGFEYQSWLGFSLFAGGASGEVGRGGTYTIVHEDGAEEAATGFSLFPGGLPGASRGGARRRLFLPVGADPAASARMRAAGWVTVAALEAGDTPEAQLCTHLLVDGEPRPLGG
ncbi:ATP phosphoribosyltransferase regulatory subunit [Sphingomonas sp. EC-HK361]|uniref:ATP phosphoribosyltransferase regulatory subunit n=1 Tax=Sphingomonas sp. EC-HK361 TaxID=2038397 RepID=UPI001257364A|nr:ATP phosphoribosyltransferase regulatory subunit [Sphingomonas sp. EC-HK361]VVT24781.1 ATP phosphoribosyltransferase regulatory subunit [Sphingomonas sp. EC-HK361]